MYIIVYILMKTLQIIDISLLHWVTVYWRVGYKWKSITVSHNVSNDAKCNLLIWFKCITWPTIICCPNLANMDSLTFPWLFHFPWLFPDFFKFPDFSRFPGFQTRVVTLCPKYWIEIENVNVVYSKKGETFAKMTKLFMFQIYNPTSFIART